MAGILISLSTSKIDLYQGKKNLDEFVAFCYLLSITLFIRPCNPCIHSPMPQAKLLSYPPFSSAKSDLILPSRQRNSQNSSPTVRLPPRPPTPLYESQSLQSPLKHAISSPLPYVNHSQSISDHREPWK